jgi:hypothetical protein
MCLAQYTYHVGADTEVTTLIKSNSTKDPSDNIQYPNSSNYYSEHNLALGINKQIDFKTYHFMITGTLYPLSQTHVLFDIYDPRAYDGDGDAYSTHYGKVTQKAHTAIYLGAGIDNWDIGIQCEAKRYDFTFGYYGTEHITEPWNNHLFIGPMLRARISISENISVGLYASRLWGPDTLARDLRDHVISNTEDYTNDGNDNPDTTFSTTWSDQLEKTEFTTTNAGFFIVYSPNRERHE